MKKAIILVLALVLALSLLTACGEKDSGGTGSTGGNSNTPGTSQGGGNNTAKEWPENKYTAGLPKPSGEILDVAVADKYGYTTVDMKWTKEEAQTYGKALTAAGVPGLGDMGDTQYAFTRDMSSDADPYFNGYLVTIKPYDDCYRISIETPDE
ncbi:MAG: hypothetical protein LBJ11_03195 [Oscillospiraceae bacterium]|jgi:hypothetical protein|nr:hypothetical protein [Oscillospiraceae bacterium]